jgi:uncharacterized protein
MPDAPGLPPLTDQFSQAYWEAAREGTLLIQRCAACGRYQFYPRGHCAGCFAPDPEWAPASGRGRLHTYTVVRRTPNAEFAADCPYVLAIVELDEGPRITARITGDADGLACDQRVHVVFTPAAPAGRAGDAGVLPNFALDRSPGTYLPGPRHSRRPTAR